MPLIARPPRAESAAAQREQATAAQEVELEGLLGIGEQELFAALLGDADCLSEGADCLSGQATRAATPCAWEMGLGQADPSCSQEV